MSGILAHFVAGPKDGEVLAVQNASLEIYFPKLLVPSLSDSPDPMTLVRTEDYVYRRRGPVVAGRAFYDFGGVRS